LGFTPPASKLSDEMLAFLRSVDSPTIANAIEAFKVRDRAEGFIGGDVESLFPDLSPMVGHAITVTVSNGPGDPGPSSMTSDLWSAIQAMPKPSVIVMKDVSGAPHRVAFAGEVMATLAQRLGAVGMVTDGALRDVHEVHALGFHYFAKYKVVSHGNFRLLKVGGPVEIGGELINTGDILHGDANGIVVIPEEVLGGLEQAVAEVRDRERRLMDYIKGDSFTLEGVASGKGY
jgi:regulator of RNase E activity RraA